MPAEGERMSLPNHCPTCNRPLQNGSQPAGKRICADCGRAIKLHDKWGIGPDGKLHHKDCSKPNGTLLKLEAKGLFS